MIATAGLLGLSGAGSAAVLTLTVALGALAALGVTKLLGRTLLRGEPSHFALELPPYRRPELSKVLVRSLLDRTLYVLARAAAVAAPAGLVIALMERIELGGMSLTAWLAELFEPLGSLMGLNGAILAAFLLALPANELVLPLALAISGEESLAALCSEPTTAICLMLFTVLHFPCSTTLLTIRRETGSLAQTALAAVLPTLLGIAVCALVRLMW